MGTGAIPATTRLGRLQRMCPAQVHACTTFECERTEKLELLPNWMIPTLAEIQQPLFLLLGREAIPCLLV